LQGYRAVVGELEGKAALVTGGTTGIGFAICQAFLREGARVALTGRNEELGRHAERSLGAGTSFLVADAADPDQIRASVREATEALGGLDVLVNNAGVGVQATQLETPLEDYDRVMDVNVRG
jgi:NAD(P)-dependent dehydrogenase (short-subunit alcohol dehydrogenase family)